MGLRCPKCGTDNLLTAVFCRGCGDKLNLNEMKPDALLNDAEEKTKKTNSKGQMIFLSVFAGIVVLILLVAAIPVSVPGAGEDPPSDEEVKTFNSIAKGGKKKKKGAAAGGGKAITLPNATASKVMTKLMELPASDWPAGPFVPEAFGVAFKDNNEMKVIVKTKAFGFMPVSLTADAKITGEPKKYAFELSGAKIGMLPMMMYGESCYDLIRQLTSKCNVVEAAKKCSEMTTTEGQISITK